MDEASSRRGETYKRLMLESFGTRWAGTQDVRDKGPGAASERAHGGVLADAAGGPRRPTDLREGTRSPMGMMEKAGAEAPAVVQEVMKRRYQQGETVGFAFRVHTNPNAHNMQARKTARDSATFLTCIK